MKTVYPIEVTKDLRGDLELIGKNDVLCSFSFDKWNNLLLIEVEEEPNNQLENINTPVKVTDRSKVDNIK